MLIPSDVGEVMGMGHEDEEWSGSVSFGSNFLLRVLKITAELPQEPSFLFSRAEMDPEGSAPPWNQAVLNILAASRATGSCNVWM